MQPKVIYIQGVSEVNIHEKGATFNIYKPAENAIVALNTAIRHVFVQIGGNWCARFYNFTTSDPQIDSLIKSDYIVYHLNDSKENKNTIAYTKLRIP